MKKKKRKNIPIRGGGGCFLVNDTRGHIFHIHLVVAESPRCNHSIIFNCMHYYNRVLDILHEHSLLCLDILFHFCCETEAHVETFYCMRLYSIYKNNSNRFTCNIVFLQVSPKIPHRQGFRPH